MDAYVVKLQFEDSLRRLPLEGGDLAFSFTQLVSRAKEIFQIPTTAQLIFTYTDRDRDVVTMAGDHDLRDALVTQALNPLRLHVAIVAGDTKISDVKMNDSLEQDQVPDSEIRNARGNLEDKNAAENRTAAATPNEETPKYPEEAMHKGISCDDCGMTPITGPRYKSLTLEDYDLCQECFEKPEVDSTEYIKIRRGRPDRRSVHFGRAFGHGVGPRSERGRRHKHGMDWKDCSGRACDDAGRREKRSGEAVHHGVECDECKTSPIVGARYKSENRFNYDLCHNCFQMVATASSSGEYTRIDQPVQHQPRYYRFVSPFSFHRFSPYDRPICGRRIRRIMVTTISDEEEEQRRAQRNAAGEKSGAAPAAAASTDVKMGEEDGQTQAKAGVPEASGSQPKGDVRTGEVTMTEAREAGDKDGAATDAVIEERQEAGKGMHRSEILTHEGMVEKLAAMGFGDSKVNEELLKKNNFDLQSTLDDLCAVKNWNPMLQELEEMGFSDSELNKRLLAQNDGNVRAAVKELVRVGKEQMKANAN